jgi:cellulose synthase/poly-beta-1,6-N-acetylglucosamine synthase-like glycosyltransferase
VSSALVVIAILIALPGAAAAVHLAVLAAASLSYREPRARGPIPPVHFCVLVPARNEEKVIARTLEAIERDRRPADLVVVVADHCSDATAAGAIVLERPLGSGQPGRAEARQTGIEYALSLPWDALVMIDADSRIEPGFFAACERMLAVGPQVLQARNEYAPAKGMIAHASIAAYALQGITIPRGRDRLGLAVRLRGTGMVLRRPIVARYRFRAAASEDLWYGLDLCLDGILPRHADSARMRSLTVTSWRSATGQRLRFEAGRMSAAREYLGALIRRHSPASLEAAWHLLTPPFAVAVASLMAGTGLALLGGATVLARTATVVLALLCISLVVGLVQARANLRTWLALLGAPWYVPWKVWVQVIAAASARRRDAVYGPTPRS